MKKLSLLLLCVFFSWSSFGKVQFKEVNTNSEWHAILEQAEAENKYIFVFVYTDWCGYCKRMKNELFSSDSLDLQEDFISIKVNGEHEFGNSISYIYNLNGYPVSLFFDKGEELISSINGFVDLVTFQTKIKAIKNFKHEASIYEEKFKQGNLDKIGQLDYIKVLHEIGKDERANQVAESYLKEMKNEELLEEENACIVKSFVTDIKSLHFDFLVTKEKLIIDKYGEPFYDAFIKNVFFVNMDKAIEQGNKELVDEVIDLVLVKYLGEASFEEGKSGTYQMYYSQTKNWVLYNEEVLEYYNKSQDVGYLCERVSIVINDFSESKEMLSYATEWLEIAENKENSYQVEMLYATVLVKSDNNKAALKKAKKAMKLAGSPEDFVSAEELIKMIENKK